MNFKNTFGRFLKAVADHDWKTMETFLHKSLPINILLPNKKPIRSYDEFVESQKVYFDNPDTYFDYEIIQVEESGDLGFGVCHSQVKIGPQQEDMIKLQICFLFKKVNNEWKLIFDQNSFLPM